MNNVTVRLKVLLAGAMATAIILSASALTALTELGYNCCGDSACDFVIKEEWCPSGAGDCVTPGHQNCCGDEIGERRCIDPSS